MRKRIAFRRPRPAVLLAAGLATAALGTFGVLSTDATGTDRPAAGPQATATATATPRAKVSVVTAYNKGWREGVAALGANGKAAAAPALSPTSPYSWDPYATAWHDGWVDGQADALGDDNRDGKVTRGETGYNPCAGEVEFIDMCKAIAKHPAYAFTDEQDRVHSVASGRAQLVQLRQTGVRPGTDRFAAALSELDTQWVQHNEN
ncbi:hypothetical protein GTY65_24455 [Streptomyces sp. SID8379]|uniref:hypothetical protein n=1 Tax=unclassified Streptomyces TaxID=2593676 RepID=UPI00036B4B18|nr:MULTISPECIES: hypothetical protein [unclassified Streptomyces]MYW67195.1 hypothetical protein [Streptomyces sp. SID8379]